MKQEKSTKYNKTTYITRLLFAIVCVTFILYPFIYKGQYAGDAQIHLVYGENASLGHFFEFNLGEKSSGVTSPGYMLLLALLFRIFPNMWVPLVIKIINYIFWYALILFTYYLSTLLIENRICIYVVTLISALLPGSAWNSTRGMENGIFGFVFILSVYLIVLWNWFTVLDNNKPWKEIILGILMGVAVWLRPEGFVVCALMLLYRLFCAIECKQVSITLKRSALFLVPFMILAISLIWFHYSSTGDLLPTSGRSRMIMGHRGGVNCGPIIFSFRFLARLMYYFPLSIFFLIGVFLTAYDYRKMHVSGEKHAQVYGRVFAIVIFLIFFVLYSTVLGSVHLARYIIFLMPLMVIIAGHTGYWLWGNWQKVFPLKSWRSLRYRAVAFSLLGVSLLILFAVETYYRFNFGSHDNLKAAMQAPKLREQYSKDLLDRLGNPPDTPVSLAFQEVQIRYWLDRRFIIRSLDGRVDPMLLNYYHNGNFDHVGYIKARHVDYVMELVNYNKDPNIWSLAKLGQLSPGETTTYQGLTFKCIYPEIIQVIHPM